MAKIIDCFLFFQELDLLEIRLEYLDEYVDLFVIVEACQTFSGKKKPFLFEMNKSRYSRFLKKICYFKIEDYHEDYESIIAYLDISGDASREKVQQVMEGFTHFPKDRLHWVLDAYHRECIQIPLNKISDANDIVILSDLDEIPSFDVFSPDRLAHLESGPALCIQKEFTYFLNFRRLKRKWLGSILGYKEDMCDVGMNGLRMDAHADRSKIGSTIEGAGYHFTTVGSINDILKKIESWAHQEYNTPRVKKRLEGRILSGQDPFGRETGVIFERVDPNDSSCFDDRMVEIINRYPHLIAPKDIRFMRHGKVRDMLDRLMNFVDKIFYKILH